MTFVIEMPILICDREATFGAKLQNVGQQRECLFYMLGGVVKIPSGARYFADSFERVLVGWHGSYDPPVGMDCELMV
jgi:hypothetical protein